MNLVLRRAERLGSIFMHVQLRPKAAIHSVNVTRRSALAQDHILASACTNRLLMREFTRTNRKRCKIGS